MPYIDPTPMEHPTTILPANPARGPALDLFARNKAALAAFGTCGYENYLTAVVLAEEARARAVRS
jgi:hypothetical protein